MKYKKEYLDNISKLMFKVVNPTYNNRLNSGKNPESNRK